MNRKRRVPINNYFAAETRLGKRESRKIDNNTYLIRRGPQEIALRLHNTDIATYWGADHPNAHKITLSNGGWLTLTTKRRLNEWTPAFISQKNWQWTVRNADGTDIAFENGMAIPETYGFGEFARDAA